MDFARQNAEVDRNYDAFARLLGQIIESHRGEVALMRDGEIADFFPDVTTALREGRRRFADGIFSIQEVDDTPIDLGIFSHASS